MAKITKAVFPVAGLGTRFLPATKATPKEMLPIVDKPLIQYAVEEAIHAGITEIIFVTSSLKRAIEDHFDSNYELENKLSQGNKTELLKIVRDILPKGVSTAYVRQPEALGLGHAVLCAEPLINQEPFAVVLADDLIDGEPGCLSQMIEAYEKHQASIIAVQHIADSETEKYGMVAVDNHHKINKIIEKPKKQDAPSDLGVVGRYILSPHIFEYLNQTSEGSGGEIQLTDGIALMLKHEDAYALPFTGKRYDCGSKLGYLEATVEFALKHNDLSREFKDYLKRLNKTIL